MKETTMKCFDREAEAEWTESSCIQIKTNEELSK